MKETLVIKFAAVFFILSGMVLLTDSILGITGNVVLETVDNGVGGFFGAAFLIIGVILVIVSIEGITRGSGVQNVSE